MLVRMGSWPVTTTDVFRDWYKDLSPNDLADVNAIVDLLAEHGPALRRPIVGAIEGPEADRKLKELIVGSIRILFAFDSRRTAVLLVGGDEAVGKKKWKKWYEDAIPQAQHLMEVHEAETAGETPSR